MQSWICHSIGWIRCSLDHVWIVSLIGSHLLIVVYFCILYTNMYCLVGSDILMLGRVLAKVNIYNFMLDLPISSSCDQVP